VIIFKSKTKIGFAARLIFSLFQKVRDIKLLEKLAEYFGSGLNYENKKTLVVELIITKFLVIQNIIIPLFKKYPIRGIKHKDFLDFVEVAKIMNAKKHLTIEGALRPKFENSKKVWTEKENKYIFLYFTLALFFKVFNKRIATRALNLKDSFYIRYILVKKKPLDVTIDNKKYKMLFKYKKTN
jgi:hypothetical protein